MMRCFSVLAALALLAVAAGLLFGDDPPKKPADTKAAPAAARHSLPTGWKALGLSDEQQKQLTAIRESKDGGTKPDKKP